MKVKIKDNEIIITLPIAKQPSKSGKTILVASTHGGQASSAIVDGKPVIVSVNAYISK
jgi:prefoldin subunit 5